MSDDTPLNSTADGLNTIPEYSECAQGTLLITVVATHDEDRNLSAHFNPHLLACGKWCKGLTANTAFGEEGTSLDDDLHNLTLEEHTPVNNSAWAQDRRFQSLRPQPPSNQAPD